MARLEQADGKWVVVLSRREQRMVRAATLTAAPAEPKWSKDGSIRCHVDPSCTWTGKSLARAKVHATPDTLQAAGHLPRAS